MKNNYNIIFWFLRTERILLLNTFFGYIPITSVLVWDFIGLDGTLNRKYFFASSIVLHSEFIILINSTFFLNSKSFKMSILFTTLQPCFFCCFFIMKYNILSVFFLIPKKTFCFFFNILYFFFKKKCYIFSCNI